MEEKCRICGNPEAYDGVSNLVQYIEYPEKLCSGCIKWLRGFYEGKEKSLTYKDSGVDIEAGNQAVQLIKNKIEQTFKFFPGKVLNELGGFCSVAELQNGTVIGTTTDGVGTKVKIAILLNRHDTIGIDLVAMCVNDLIVHNVNPAGFLDYIAQGKQIPERTDALISGMISSCNSAKTALLGGEMAEMPGIYKEEDYDLAGFAFGFAKSKGDLIFGQKIRPGMKVFGLPSFGLHSNGYSLARKVYGIDDSKPEEAIKILNSQFMRTTFSLGDELLRATMIYVQTVEYLLKRYEIAGMAHITGGGLVENPLRILPEGCAIRIDWERWPILPIFKDIQQKGNISDREMRRTFNNGIGFILISPDEIQEAYEIGEIIEGERVVIFD
ncbi:MAG: phosphoribosylformylglycinamidine cyclo-ligase [bacterium]